MRNRLFTSKLSQKPLLKSTSKPKSETPRRQLSTSSVMNSVTEPEEFISVRLPSIPRQVDIHHILNMTKNNIPCPLTAKQVEQIKQALHGKENGKYSKKRELPALGINIPFSIIKINDNYFTLYQGRKHEKLCGMGTRATAKFAQHIDSGEWIAVKIQTSNSEIDYTKEITATEVTILKSMNAMYGTFERISPKKGFQTYILMKLVSGKTMVDYLRYMEDHNRTMSMHHALNIGINLFDTLNRLHNEYRITHNDLHGGNVIFHPPREKVKAIDFGFSINLDLTPAIEHPHYVNVDIASASHIMKSVWKKVTSSATQYPNEEKIGNEIIHYLDDKMKSAISNKSVTIAADPIKAHLQDIKNSLPHHEYEIAEFDISMLYHKNTVERESYLAKMRKFDRITLINTSNKQIPIFELISIKRELESRGVLVSDSIKIKNQPGIFTNYLQHNPTPTEPNHKHKTPSVTK